MTRPHFIAGLLGLSVAAKVGTTETREKFYITGFAHTPTANDCTVPPLISYGRDRIDALVKSGVTVWTEKEWLEMRKETGKSFDQGCKQLASGASHIGP
jgi:hypothetical protein